MFNCSICRMEAHLGETCLEARERRKNRLPPPRDPSNIHAGYGTGHYTVKIDRDGHVGGFKFHEAGDPRRPLLERAGKLTKLLLSRGMEPAVAVDTAIQIVLGEV